MIELLLATALTCSEAEKLIEDIEKVDNAVKEELIEVIKTNTQKECYEGSKRNS